jgi:hypothetical protein
VVTARPDGFGNGYNNVVADKGAFQRIFRVGESRVIAYSLGFGRSVPMGESTVYSAVSRGSSGVRQVDKAADLAVRSSSIGEPLEDTNAEAAAVQLAIWMFTDGVDPAPTGLINAPLSRRAEELSRAATALAGGNREITVGMSSTVSGSGDRRRLTVNISSGGQPLAGVPVSVEIAGSSLDIRSNDDGVAILRLTDNMAGERYRASFRWRLPAGTVLLPADGAAVITASAAEGIATFTGTIPARPTSSPTRNAPAPVKTPRPTPTPSAAATIEDETPTPAASTSEEASTSEVEGELGEDPAELVIEFTEEGQTEPAGDPSVEPEGSPSSSTAALILAGVVFVVAVFIARRRIQD